ncbi:MAG: aspartate aminotransferase family protein [Alphaproteobacteria bacterium]|nr:aspartate aminotransferase family protein [Alphaproteobacteria bacterium]
MNAPMPAGPASNNYYATLRARKSAIEARYRTLTPTSAKLHEEAKSVLPGGVTRDAALRKPYPTFIDHGEGSYLFDVDGRRISDFWFNATSLVLGNAHPAVVEAVGTQLGKGTAFAAPGRLEMELAGEIIRRLPSAEKVRFTNSGSEAVMLALRLARAFTGRDMIAKFEGSYHGSYDDVAWSVGGPAAKLGERTRPNAVPETGGLPSGFGRTIVLPYNDIAATTTLVEENAGRIAALIVEPMASRMGLVLPSRAFIEGLRRLCDKHGIVLIFDEVIAFRIGYHGAQGLFGVTPDMTTLGKVIGGGFPVGGVAGRSDIMMQSDAGKAGRVTHAGTFNGNPITMAAGLATLRQLTPEVFDRINATGEKVRTTLRRLCEGLPLQVSGVGSLFKITASNQPVENYRHAVAADHEWEEIASLALLCDGFFLTTHLAGCISVVTTEEQVDDLMHRVGAMLSTG